MDLIKFLQNNPKKYLIFDFDETIATLILPWPILGEKLNIEFKKYGDEVVARCNTWNWAGYNETIKELGPSFKKSLDTLYLDFETDYIEGLKNNDGIISFIKDNKSKYSFYIWSNNQRPTILRALKELSIEDCFEVIVSASDVTLCKPDPIGFKQIYNPSIEKKEYLMIGDSEGDRNAAKNVGIDFLHISSH